MVGLVIVYASLNLVALMITGIHADVYGNIPKFRESSLLFIFVRLVLFPAYMIIGFVSNYGKDIMNFLSAKPFKKCNFQVGETVLYKSKEFKVLKNEKLMDGDNLLLEDEKERYDWDRYITVEASKVRKISKLEQALK